MGRVGNSSTIINAHAKLNIALYVTGRRSDGYHLLSMCNVKIGLSDTLEITLTNTDEIRLEVHGITTDAKQTPLNSDSNSIVRALKGFRELFRIPIGAEIVLRKKIPVGAGLGGGSSDAAAVLRFLQHRYNKHTKEDTKTIMELALSLGADVPFFFGDTAALVSGIGEELNLFQVYAPQPVLVIIPPVPLMTRDVFARFRERGDPFSESPVYPAGKNFSHHHLVSLVHNDLIPAAGSLYPELKALLEAFTGVGVVSMTGSGSALFCIPEVPGPFTQEALNVASQAVNRYGSTIIQTEIIP